MNFDSKEWWNEHGPFRLLHEWLPLRLDFILKTLHKENLEQESPKETLSGWTVADVGCGGGLVSEPLARLGAKVMGIDPEPEAIACAQQHYAQCKDPTLDLSYICHNPLTWECPGQMDAVVLLEVLEHVDRPFDLIKKMLKCLRPGGFLVGSTIHRNTLSAVLGIGLAENILGWVPKGTHRWDLFLTPEEIRQGLHDQGCESITIQGCIYVPLVGWRYCPYPSMNYFFSARKNSLTDPIDS